MEMETENYRADEIDLKESLCTEDFMETLRADLKDSPRIADRVLLITLQHANTLLDETAVIAGWIEVQKKALEHFMNTTMELIREQGTKDAVGKGEICGSYQPQWKDDFYFEIIQPYKYMYADIKEMKLFMEDHMVAIERFLERASPNNFHNIEYGRIVTDK